MYLLSLKIYNFIHMKKLLFFCFLVLSFNINSQTSADVDCTAGPTTTSFCYDTGLDNSYSFTSLDGSPMNLTINSGQVENGWDELIILDSDGTELYNGYGAGGDVSGLTFQSSEII